MKEEVIKSYKVPIEAPRDLVEAYFEAKRRALREVLGHVAYSQAGKAHLRFKAGDRRRLRNKLLKGLEILKTLHRLRHKHGHRIGQGMDKAIQ